MRIIAAGFIAVMMALGSIPAAKADSATDGASVTVTSTDNDTETGVSVVQHPQTQSGGGNADGDGSKQRVLSYGSILKMVKKTAPGDIVKVLLLQRQRGQWIYEFEVLDSAGRLTRLTVNARTAAIISTSRR